MTAQNLLKKTAMFIFVGLPIFGCDHFHQARIVMDPRPLQQEKTVPDNLAEEKVIAAVKEFAANINFDCSADFYRLQCGPHGELRFYKENSKFVVTLFQMWGDSRCFCNVQGHMFEYFYQKFGAENVKFETNDSCGRRNYP